MAKVHQNNSPNLNWDIDCYYARSLRIGMIGALLLVTTAFIFLPKEFVITPYSLKKELTTIMEVLPQEVNKITEPQSVERPKLPIAAQGPEEIEKSTIDPTTKFEEISRRPEETALDTVLFWKLEKKPEILKYPKPIYPELARLAGIEGIVFVNALVDVDGKIIDAHILKSSNNAALDNAALQAVYQVVFTPAMQRDKFVRVWVSIPFHFKLGVK